MSPFHPVLACLLMAVLIGCERAEEAPSPTCLAANTEIARLDQSLAEIRQEILKIDSADRESDEKFAREGLGSFDAEASDDRRKRRAALEPQAFPMEQELRALRSSAKDCT